jgi:hypothetical protein
MKTIIYFIGTLCISTGCMFGALNSTDKLPFFVVAFGIWALFFWGCNKRMKRRAAQRYRERLFEAFMREQMRKRYK